MKIITMLIYRNRYYCPYFLDCTSINEEKCNPLTQDVFDIASGCDTPIAYYASPPECYANYYMEELDATENVGKDIQRSK